MGTLKTKELVSKTEKHRHYLRTFEKSAFLTLTRAKMLTILKDKRRCKTNKWKNLNKLTVTVQESTAVYAYSSFHTHSTIYNKN